MSIIEEQIKENMENAKKNIEKAKAYIVITNESVMAKCKKSELIMLISSMLCNFVKEKMIDDKDLDLIIRCVKGNTKGNTKDNTESIEDILDRITDEMIENLFKEKWSDK